MIYAQFFYCQGSHFMLLFDYQIGARCFMPHVQVRPSKDLRNHYREIANLAKNNNPVIITSHGKGDTVLISMEDYAKFEDFAHQQYIINALDEAEERAKDPNTKWYSHDEFWERIRARRTTANV
jgi:prevent-host-death family protein